MDDTDGKIICDACYPGLMPSDDGSSCIPQECEVSNCQICMPSNQKACLNCLQGYSLNPYYQCVPFNPMLATSTCDVYNCLFCGENNTCAQCIIGWNTTEKGTCVT